MVLSFVAAFFVIFYVKENATGAKHLQYVSGARITTFWFVSYIWDFLIFLIIHVFWLVTLVAYQEDGFKTFEDIGK